MPYVLDSQATVGDTFRDDRGTVRELVEIESAGIALEILARQRAWEAQDQTPRSSATGRLQWYGVPSFREAEQRRDEVARMRQPVRRPMVIGQNRS